MRRRAVLLALGTLIAFGAGAAGGAYARRTSDRRPPVAATERPKDLDTAWARLLRGERLEPGPAIALPGGSDALLGERELIAAVAEGGDGALEEVSRRRSGTNAGALAEILLVERARDDAERRARREAFARRYPRSWWNTAPSARSPR